ncbi:universal stress protein [Streptomyces sp. NPDC050560]|uniref:universal stress protein n=1 Tax=Streptomyces sp. NPDC050560 TaxID=3365630 RepID=UPI0037BA9800
MIGRHVVVGVDGSLVATRALDGAAREALWRGVALRVVYAVQDRDEAGPVLAAAVSRVRERHPRLPVTATAVEADAARALVGAGHDAELTVVGARGLGPVAGLLLGSVAVRLAAHLNGPLLVVLGDHPPAERGRVVVALEGEADTAAVEYAFAEAERRAARLVILCAWEQRHLPQGPPPRMAVRAPGAVRVARRLGTEVPVARTAVERLRRRHPLVEVDTRMVRTVAPQTLLRSTGEADVVVAARPHTAGLPGPRLGWAVHTLLGRSRCPVLIVPT